jgi:hypothetical protein
MWFLFICILYMYLCMYVCMYLCMYVCIDVCVCVRARACVCLCIILRPTGLRSERKCVAYAVCVANTDVCVAYAV